MKRFITVLIYILLHLAVIITAFMYSAFLGIFIILAYLLILGYIKRAGVFNAIGTFKYSRGQTDSAIEWFKRSYDSGKAKPVMAISYAYVLMKAGKPGPAEEILDKLIASNISNDDRNYARANRALIYWKKDMLDKAITELEDVFKDYKTTTIYGSLGYMLILGGDMEKALVFNTEAYEYNNTNTVILDNLGQTYYLLGEDDKALEIYGELMKKNPTFPEAYYNYGLVLLRKDERERAIENMKKALGYKFSYLSTVTKEDIESRIKELN